MGLVAVLLTGCGAAPVAPVAAWRYVVRPAADLTRLDATLCFRGQTPPRIGTGGRGLDRYVVRADRVRSGVRTPVTPSAQGLRLDDPAPGECVDYTVDLTAAAAAGDLDVAAQAGEALVSSADLWLLRPPRVPRDLDATVRFVLPAGHAVATPWPVTGNEHRLSWGAFEMTTHVAFGRLASRVVQVPGGALDVHRLGSLRAYPGDAPERWVESSARAVAGLYGGLPAPRVQVLLVPAAGTGVRFGMAHRGGGAGVVLLVGADASPAAITGSWIAPHELAHLGVPSMRRADAWLFEGLATYYTYVLQGRAGVLDEAGVWRELHAGFGRGRSSGGGLPLRDESAQMHRTRAWWRVYWAGAAFALDVDVTLREESGGAWSLDRVLAQLARCCARDERLWTADETLTRMDALLGRPFFAPRAARALERTGFPDTGPAYRALGLVPLGDRLVLDPAPRAAALRRAIVRGP